MSADWHRLDELFHAALEKAPAERAAFLTEACADNEELRKEVEALLTADALDQDWLPHLAAATAVGWLTGNQAEVALGQRVGNYEIRALLGKGGMGQVFEALDLRLNRVVALKFILGSNPSQRERFLQEAQAQARITHENVCQVYEVGEIGTRPYIAMERIVGQPIKEVARSVPREDLIRLVKEAATGLHAAHRLGIIHRDVKPANLLVRTTPDGIRQACLMDFGLARDLDEQHSLTETGFVLGTPAYMSPEQAQGAKAGIDRRADVYSLGATLYELLTGVRPFEADSALAVMVQVLEAEPIPPRKHVPALPPDLEAIVLKCLEKEPHRRYDSAKALADDLNRYLEGEPVQAQQTSWWYWAAKKAKKQKSLVAAIAIGSLLVMILGGLLVFTRWTAATQARLAQTFGQEAEKIEAIVRQAYTLPLHNIQPERGLIQARVAAIRNRMREAGSLSEGAGNFALGRAYLALHEYAQARQALDLAWKGGFRDPEIHYVQGRVLGKLYQKELEDAERISNSEIRQQRKREIERTWAVPALAALNQYVRENGGQTESPAFVASEIAFYQHDYLTARRKAQEAFQQVPWLYEAKKLEGDILLAMGRDEQATGHYENAVTYFNQAAACYDQAATIGRSDPLVYLGLAARWMQVLEMESSQEKPLDETVRQAVAACRLAIAADPAQWQSYSFLAIIYWRQATDYHNQGKDASASLAQSIHWAQEALQRNPQDARTLWSLGTAYQLQGRHAISQGHPPGTAFAQAIASYQQATSLNPHDVSVLNSLGNTYYFQSLHEIHTGRTDPHASFAAAIQAYQEAIRQHPQISTPYNGLGNTYGLQGEYESTHGLDPLLSLQRSIEAYQKAIALNPQDVAGYYNLGPTFRVKGNYELSQGQDPGASYEQAAAAYQTALRMAPNSTTATNNLGSILVYQAHVQNLKGITPEPLLQEAAGYLHRTSQLNPNYSLSWINLAGLYYEQAKWEFQTGKNPQEAIGQGLQAVQTAQRLGTENPLRLIHRTNLELLSAQVAILRRKRPEPFFEQAQTSLNQALKPDPQDQELLRLQGRLNLRRAAWALQQRQSPLPFLEIGLKAATDILTTNPRDTEAQALQARLLQLQAQLESEPDRRAERLRQTRELFHQALARNPFLKREYGD
ncbi:MAG: protein kinase [Blastocatellia bacterium]|nr:protein kinase [Blastocatellia bacterium]